MNLNQAAVFLFLISVMAGEGCGEAPKNNKLFTLLAPSDTNISFSNNLKADTNFNIIEYLYFYDGGGVAVGDINNDGLADIYFTANQSPNKLYLNKGHFAFEDITGAAAVGGRGDWKTGVCMADVNGDGFLDIYVSQVGDYKGISGANQLFINNGDMTFTEKAKDYGLAFVGFSTQASFFDYDNDGDLDMYLLNHSVHTSKSYGPSTLRLGKDAKAGDKLFRNDFEDGQPHFVDVTEEAKIYSSHIGYGLGISVGDINKDGCIDIFISNDFHENDYLYLNNCDGTFTESLAQSMWHTSRSSMGNDLADFNNDGWLDLVVLDMLPNREDILKKSAGEDRMKIFQKKLDFGYYPQLVRNTLQLNRGNGFFSEIALLAGIYATDWSWTPLFGDFDNDGFKDLFVSNGIFKRPNDLDYVRNISKRKNLPNDSSDKESHDQLLMEKMPSEKIANFIFQNNRDLTFADKTVEWGIDQPVFSNGAVYADLDNDGDLDLIVNNINQEAFIYRNNSERLSHNNFLISVARLVQLPVKLRTMSPMGSSEPPCPMWKSVLFQMSNAVFYRAYVIIVNAPPVLRSARLAPPGNGVMALLKLIMISVLAAVPVSMPVLTMHDLSIRLPKQRTNARSAHSASIRGCCRPAWKPVSVVRVSLVI